MTELIAMSGNDGNFGYVNDPASTGGDKSCFLLADFGGVIPGEQQRVIRIGLGEFAVGFDRNMGAGRQPALLDRGGIGNEFHVCRSYSAIVDNGRTFRRRSIADDAFVLIP